MVITLCGDDNARLSARLRQLVVQHAPGELATFNLSELDGADITLPALRAACDAFPFMGDERVVVVKGLLGRFSEKDGENAPEKGAAASFAKELRAYLPEVPASTVLMVVERRKIGAGVVAKVLRDCSTLEEYSFPDRKDLQGYVTSLAQQHGTRVDRDAAGLLAEAVGEQPARLQTELLKLIAYKAGEIPITAEDVRSLVDMPLEIVVWDLTDAIYARRSRAALRALRALRERGQPTQLVIGALASQIRNLVLADDHRGKGPDHLVKATGMKPYSARKASTALRDFEPKEPSRILTALMELDFRSKTGKAELDSALELLIVNACERRL
jgi:DNA polymerase-3 subunit delta